MEAEFELEFGLMLRLGLGLLWAAWGWLGLLWAAWGWQRTPPLWAIPSFTYRPSDDGWDVWDVSPLSQVDTGHTYLTGGHVHVLRVDMYIKQAI